MLYPPKLKIILPAAAGGLILPRPPQRPVEVYHVEDFTPPAPTAPASAPPAGERDKRRRPRE
jgi:hypothetical protein